MIKKFRKAMAFIGMSIVMSMMTSTPALAIDYTAENSLTSLAQYGSGDNIVFVSPDKVIKDTYWADLEPGSVSKEYNKTCYGVFPKYVLKPSETALKGWAITSSDGGIPRYFPSSGITETAAGMGIADKTAFYRLGYLVGGDNYPGLSPNDPIPDSKNPFGFEEKDLLTQEEIKDPTKLTVYADIKKKGASNSTEIGEYKHGESLDLEFSMDASWFKRFIMGHTLDLLRAGYMSDQDVQDFYNDREGAIDSQIVYTIDIPKEVDVKDPSATLTGLDGFDVTTEVKDNADYKTLVVNIRLNEEKQAQSELWKDTVKKLKKIDTSAIKISVAGLSVSSTAKPESNVTLRGTVSGYFEWVLGKRLYAKSAARTRATDPSSEERHTHLYFVAKQGDKGRDSGAPEDKPNLISYTFKVNNKSDNSTVTFINGSKTHAVVKVETGKSIDSDALTDESMPKKPIKKGCKFKEWNTGKDGKGTKFTGSTVVNEDMTVYAVYTKKSIEKPDDKKPDTGDGTNLTLYVVLLVLSVMSFIVAGFRNRGKEN